MSLQVKTQVLSGKTLFQSQTSSPYTRKVYMVQAIDFSAQALGVCGWGLLELKPAMHAGRQCGCNCRLWNTGSRSTNKPAQRKRHRLL